MSRTFYVLLAAVGIPLLMLASYITGLRQHNAELQAARDTIHAIYEAYALPTQTPGPLAGN